MRMRRPPCARPFMGCSARLRGSMNTDTDARPSEYTRCCTGTLEPAMTCTRQVVSRDPAGKRITSQPLAGCGQLRLPRRPAAPNGSLRR